MQKENDKYYTPDISEFYIGFEYELQCIKPIKDNRFGIMLKKQVFDSKRWSNVSWNVDFHYDLMNGRIRVKYLDKEDIESLGFSLKVETKFGVTFSNRLYSIILSKMKGNHIEIYLTEPYTNESDGLKFSGIIKNKSELKKLLKQLVIQ